MARANFNLYSSLKEMGLDHAPPYADEFKAAPYEYGVSHQSTFGVLMSRLPIEMVQIILPKPKYFRQIGGFATLKLSS